MVIGCYFPVCWYDWTLSTVIDHIDFQQRYISVHVVVACLISYPDFTLAITLQKSQDFLSDTSLSRLGRTPFARRQIVERKTIQFPRNASTKTLLISLE